MVEINPKRSQTRWLALLVATGICLYICWQMVQPFVDVLLWAAVLAVVFHPINMKLRGKLGGPSRAAMATCGLAVLTVVVPAALIVLAIINESHGAADSLQAGLKRVLDPSQIPAKWIAQYVDLRRYLSVDYLSQRLSQFGGAIVERTLGFLGTAVGIIVQVFVALFTLYYLLRDADSAVGAIQRMLPLTKSQSRRLFSRSRDVINASLNGVLVIAGVQGALGALAFWVLGLPSPLLWGVVMFFLSTIPMAGSTIVWAPAALYLLLNGHWVKAILLTAWGAGVIGTIDNVLRPRLVGGRTRLHELIVFFSVLGGLKVFGVLGIVIGPVVAAITLALLEIFREAEDEPSAIDEPPACPAPSPRATHPAPADTATVEIPVHEAAASSGAVEVAIDGDAAKACAQ